MSKQAIHDQIRAAEKALKPSDDYAATVDTEVTPGTAEQYDAEAGRMIGSDPDTKKIIPPRNPDPIIAKVRTARTKATLRKRARSVRHVALKHLSQLLKFADQAQRAGDWNEVERIVMHPVFQAYIVLARMMPADYANGWKPVRPRKGKKSSLLRLPADWREQLAARSRGQFRVPTLMALMTGCRPQELEKGVFLIRTETGLYVRIRGAKVTEKSGQKFRRFRLADHPLTDELIAIMQQSKTPARMIVKVEHGNSVTTHLRAIGHKLWPRRTETITVYTARHGMAAACKAAIAEGADPDLVSQVLGHIVDETASYYGNRFQSGGRIIVPSNIKVTKAIKHKQRSRIEVRRLDGEIPSKKHHVDMRLKLSHQMQ